MAVAAHGGSLRPKGFFLKKKAVALLNAFLSRFTAARTYEANPEKQRAALQGQEYFPSSEANAANVSTLSIRYKTIKTWEKHGVGVRRIPQRFTAKEKNKKAATESSIHASVTKGKHVHASPKRPVKSFGPVINRTKYEYWRSTSANLTQNYTP